MRGTQRINFNNRTLTIEYWWLEWYNFSIKLRRIKL